MEQAVMTILEVGTFNVSQFRKPISSHAKSEVLLRMSGNSNGLVQLLRWTAAGVRARNLEVDHSPALALRKYDTEAHDFIPPQGDLDYLVLLLKEDHQTKTTGRKPGAQRTVTTRDSDVGELKRTQRMRIREAVRRDRAARRDRRKISWPKRKLPSRLIV
jgi:hypothetical protein